MTTQPEYILEENLVEQLQDLGYAKVNIKDETELIANLIFMRRPKPFVTVLPTPKIMGKRGMWS